MKSRLTTSCRLVLTKKAKIRAYLARFVVASQERFMAGIKKLSSIAKCLKKSYPSLCPTFFALLITVSERHCVPNFYVRGIAKNGILLANVANFYVPGLAENGNSQIQYSILVMKLTWSENELFFLFLRP